ncbi:D-tyrosyl-tRNA(Tyr) deacylase [Lichtheimia ornata]|uniref:D-aminoacyl-tRNA deacylase n=1 Tax=Lichtheimia ornata TaxID=688661 RepID=A0AAD7V5I1_9FUNG|nr:D-tyrosyl-tRNA(Tyr) deacylase [Lichtheimia ornata]KAJ8658963.1 D-tyrosyl-tRNA(Tyr) deacylase [Lichtheimia ornata]
MRAVLQRVTRASVTVDDKVVSSIQKGVCVLVGVGADDNERDIDTIVNKILNIRVFEDEQGTMWKKGVKDLGLEVLCVSQFTLQAKTIKGNKPDFHRAMKTNDANALYQKFLTKMGDAYDPSKIKDGVFGAMMVVDIANDGPVTLQLDSRKYTYDSETPSQASTPK